MGKFAVFWQQSWVAVSPKGNTRFSIGKAFHLFRDLQAFIFKVKQAGSRFSGPLARGLGIANATGQWCGQKTRAFVRWLFRPPLPVHEESSYVPIYCHLIKPKEYPERNDPSVQSGHR